MPIVGDIIPNSLAKEKGLEKGDLITKIDDTKISSFSEAQFALSKRLGESGDIKVYVLRDKNTFLFNLPINNWLSKKDSTNLLYELGIFPPIEPIVGSVLEESPAEKGGLKPKDKIIEINKKPINYWADIKQDINESNGEEISIKVLREENIVVLKITPILAANNFNYQIGINSSFELSEKAKILEKSSLKQSFINAFSQTYEVIENSILFLGKILFGQISAKNLGGPVMIGQYAGESIIYGGLYSFFYLIALISISLGIVNLLPLPILDGGQALILTIERLYGKNLPDKFLDFFYRISILFLIFLFIFVFFNDMFRIFLK